MKVLLMILFLTVEVLFFVYVFSKIRSFFRKMKNCRRKYSKRKNSQVEDSESIWEINGALAMMDQ